MTVDELAAIIAHHLPETQEKRPREADTIAVGEALGLLLAYTEGGAMFGLGSKRKKGEPSDLARLKTFRDHLAAAVDAYHELSPETQSALTHGTRDDLWMPAGAYAAMRGALDAFDARMPEAELAANEGENPGTMNWRARSVAYEAGNIWRRHRPGDGMTFNDAPRPFKSFLADVFRSLRINGTASYFSREANDLRKHAKK